MTKWWRRPDVADYAQTMREQNAMLDAAGVTMDWVFKSLEGAPLPHKQHCPCPVENCDDEEFWEREWTALGKHLDSPEAK